MWILILLVVVVVAGSTIFLKVNKSNTKVALPAAILASPIPTPSPWKVYKNEKYGFSVTYPRIGVIAQKEGFIEGECGGVISEEKKGTNDVTLDNFFGVNVAGWNGTIDDYIKSRGAFEKYNTEVILESGADESIALKGLRPNVEYAVGYPPLQYVIALYKKGNNVFLLQTFQNPTNFGGCIFPGIVNPSDYPEITKQKWDMVKSIKFFPLVK